MEFFDTLTDRGMEFLRALESIRTPFLDELFLLITKLGEETIPIVVMCFVLWCINKRMACAIGVSFFLSGMSVHALKIGCRIDRPWILDPNFTIVERAREAASGYSFPSGHTQNAGSILLTLGLWNRKKMWVLPVCIFTAVLVAFSRMYLGVHTPADVTVGFIIALAASVIAVAVFGGKNKQLAQNIVLAVVIVCSGALAAYAGSLYGSGIIDSHYTADALKMAGAGIGFALGLFVEHRYINYSEKTEKAWQQIVKFAIGLIGVLALKSGIKAIFGESLTVDFIRYFLVIVWAVDVWPFIFSKWLFKKEESATAL